MLNDHLSNIYGSPRIEELSYLIIVKEWVNQSTQGFP